MKKITPVSVLLLNFIILVLVLNIYRYTSIDINQIEEEYISYKKLSLEYQNDKNSFYTLLKAEKKITKIMKQMNITNVHIVKQSKKLIIKISDLTLQKKDKLLNKILNDKFIILKLNIDKTKFEIELGK